MAVIQVKTFQDIYTAVAEELKIPLNDTDALDRIKRDVNMIYIHEVVPYERWRWLREEVDLVHPAAFETGTASVTQNSVTVTLTTAPALSRRGHWFSTSNFGEVYRIIQHTAGSTTLTLEAPYNGSTDTDAGFQIWTDSIPLPTECRETIQVTHDFSRKEIEAVGYQEFSRLMVANPKREGRPFWYTTDERSENAPYETISGLPAAVSRASSDLVKTFVFASDVSTYIQKDDRVEVTGAGHYSYNQEYIVADVSTTTVTVVGNVPYSESTTADTGFSMKLENKEESARTYRRLRVFPAIFDQKTVLHVSYVENPTPLEDDDDEPLMPLSDRIILVYGACWRAWSRERNTSEAAKNSQLYDRKLGKMAGKIEDSVEKARFRPSRHYLQAKRNHTLREPENYFRPIGSGSGSGSSLPIDTPNTVAVFDGTGTLAASSAITTTELALLDGITSDLVDIDTAQTLTNKTIVAASNTITTAASGNLTATELDAALAELQTDIDTRALDSDLTTHTADTTTHGTTGDIVGTSDTQTLTNKTIDADNNTVSNLAHGAEVDNPSSGVHGVTGNVVGTTDTQTLTNKTLTSPVITGLDQRAAFTTKTAAYTIASTDEIIFGDTSSAAFTLTLPPVSGLDGKVYTIQYTDSGFANALTVDGDGSETVGGSASTTLDTEGETITLLCDETNTNWIILRRDIPNIDNSYTPGCTWSTNVSPFGRWTRDGRFLEGVVGLSVDGSVGSPGALQFDLPSGLTMDTTAMARVEANATAISGSGVVQDNSTGDTWEAVPTYVDTNTLGLMHQVSATGIEIGTVTHSTPVATPAVSDHYMISFRVPISGWNG